jgi:hypothetical protein
VKRGLEATGLKKEYLPEKDEVIKAFWMLHNDQHGTS